jgi:cell division protein FtsZ
MENAEIGIRTLRKEIDTLVVIPNDKLWQNFPKGITVVQAFLKADEVLRQGIQGISDLIVYPSLVNLDFADVRSVMKNRGMAHMGIGVGKGDNRTIDAVRQAVFSPLLETTIEGATGVIINFTGGSDLTMDEAYQAANLVKEVVDPSADTFFGVDIREDIDEEVQVTLIATGFDTKHEYLEDRKNLQTEDTFFRPHGANSMDIKKYEEVLMGIRTQPQQPPARLRSEVSGDTPHNAATASNQTVTYIPPAKQPEVIQPKVPAPRINTGEQYIPAYLKKLQEKKK